MHFIQSPLNTRPFVPSTKLACTSRIQTRGLFATNAVGELVHRHLIPNDATWEEKLRTFTINTSHLERQLDFADEDGGRKSVTCRLRDSDTWLRDLCYVPARRRLFAGRSLPAIPSSLFSPLRDVEHNCLVSALELCYT